MQLQLYVCYNRYAGSACAACRYDCVELCYASTALALGCCLGGLLWRWDLALVSCFGGGILLG